jgi:hypothetical protein
LHGAGPPAERLGRRVKSPTVIGRLPAVLVNKRSYVPFAMKAKSGLLILLQLQQFGVQGRQFGLLGVELRFG